MPMVYSAFRREGLNVNRSSMTGGCECGMTVPTCSMPFEAHCDYGYALRGAGG